MARMEQEQDLLMHNFTVTKDQVSIRKRFPCLLSLYSVDICLWRGVKGFVVMWFCLIFGAALRKFLLYFAVLRFYKTRRFVIFRNFQVIAMHFAVFLCNSVQCLYLIQCGFVVFVPALCPPPCGSR